MLPINLVAKSWMGFRMLMGFKRSPHEEQMLHRWSNKFMFISFKHIEAIVLFLAPSFAS